MEDVISSWHRIMFYIFLQYPSPIDNIEKSIPELCNLIGLTPPSTMKVVVIWPPELTKYLARGSTFTRILYIMQQFLR